MCISVQTPILLAAVLLPAATLLPPATLSAQEGALYRIGVRDKVEIRVEELADVNSEFDVADDGTLELPHVGLVTAQGRTEDELAVRIRQLLLDSGMRRATVSVRVTRIARPVVLLGAVAEPGNRVVSGRATLLDVILEAGGLAAAPGPVVLVRRRASNGLSDQVEIALRELLELGDPSVNIPIYAGDVIRVPAAPQIHVSFLGEVESAGDVGFRGNERATLLVAIARAGGLTEAASNKIRILRGEGAEKQEILANYRRILSGKDPDIELEDGDIVVVRESFF